jgi:uncharacterized protein YrrD
MYKGKDLVGRKVVDFAEGKELGKVEDIIFSGVDGRVLGLLLDEGGLLASSKVVAIAEVSTIGPDAIVIESPELVKTASDVEVINNRLAADNVVVGTKLLTEDGRDLGKISDVYFSEMNGHIEGYEVSGGIFSDAYTGKSYLPTPQSLRLGEDVAFVPNEFADVIHKQTGGVKGAVDPYLEKAHAKYEDFKEVSKEKYDAMSTEAKKKYDEAKVRAELLKSETSDKLEDYREISKEKYSELSAEAKVKYDEASTKYAELSDDAKAKYQQQRQDAIEATAAKTVDEAKGRRANHTVYSDEGYIVVAQGQYVDDSVVTKAKKADKSADLLNAVNLSSRKVMDQKISRSGDNAKQAAGSAWNTLKSKASQLFNQAEDKVQEKRIQRALGRPTNRVVLDKNDDVLLDTGQIITRESIDKARSAGVLELLLTSVDTSGPDLSNEDRKLETNDNDK